MIPIEHTLVCGATRSGKSEAELVRMIPRAQANDCALVLLDPPGTLAAKFLLQLHSLGLSRRLIYDRLADTDCVPGYNWLSRSQHAAPLQREAENDERIREFAAILVRRRNLQDMATTPLIEEGILAALRLYLYQSAPVPLSWLADVFDVRSPERAHLLRSCTRPDLVRKFEMYASLSPTARRTETGPAERILRAVVGSPAFRVRSERDAFDFDRFLNERGILVLDGSSRGNLSRDAASVMMGAVLLRVMRHCRTGSQGRVLLVLDEAVNANLVGVHESRAIAEAAKWGLEFHVIVQDPFNFPSEEIRNNVLQNCGRHEWFRQGSPDAARLAAEDVAIPILDPLRVHHTEQRVRTSDAGYQRLETKSRTETLSANGTLRGRSTTWSTVLWPRRREVTDSQDRYMELKDQVLLMQKELMLLQPGYRFVRPNSGALRPEYVPMLRAPWFAFEGRTAPWTPDPRKDVATRLFADALAVAKQRSEYGTPAAPASTGRRVSRPLGAGARLALLNRMSTARGE